MNPNKIMHSEMEMKYEKKNKLFICLSYHKKKAHNYLIKTVSKLEI